MRSPLLARPSLGGRASFFWRLPGIDRVRSRACISAKLARDFRRSAQGPSLIYQWKTLPVMLITPIGSASPQNRIFAVAPAARRRLCREATLRCRPARGTRGLCMTDADFAEAVLRSLEKLDTACLDFIDADTANPRDLQLVSQSFRHVNDCIAALLNHDLLRLDELAMKVLQSAPGAWSSRLREEITAGQATNVADLHCRVRRRHPSLLNLAKLLRGKQQDADPPCLNPPPADSKQKLKQPPDDAIACYRLSIATGRGQRELAEVLSRELGRSIGQPAVSRWLKQVSAWLKAGNVLPDLTADSGPKPKMAVMDPAKIDRGDGRKKATRPRRSDDADRNDELQRLIDEQKSEDDYEFDRIEDESD